MNHESIDCGKVHDLHKPPPDITIRQLSNSVCRIVFYARSAQHSFFSNANAVDKQIGNLDACIEKNDLHVVARIKEMGVSGAHLHRKGWEEVMGYVRRGEVDAVGVADLGRMSRSTKSGIELLHEACRHGVRFFSNDIGFMSRDFMTSYIHVQTVLAYSREATRNALRKRAKGGRNSSTPSGFMFDAADRSNLLRGPKG